VRVVGKNILAQCPTETVAKEKMGRFLRLATARASAKFVTI